jgi:anaerobic glycerol-3-phosphate dehydrogenase
VLIFNEATCVFAPIIGLEPPDNTTALTPVVGIPLDQLPSLAQSVLDQRYQSILNLFRFSSS